MLFRQARPSVGGRAPEPSSGGWFVFTVEALGDADKQPHALGASGRYAHRASYVGEALADAGFSLQVLRNETLRMESGLPVEGCVVVARSGAEDG